MNPAGNWTRFGCIATILLLFATFPAAGHAQAQGAIAGTVRDGATNQGLAGAQVLIAALSIGSLSGNDGSFEVEGVPAGTHTVEVQRIGYAIVRQEVAVTAGSETRLDVTMAEEAIILGGITAIGTRARPRTVTESAVPVDVIPASVHPGARFMRCQQRARRRCPRGSSDVREADRAPPADADLLRESTRNLDRGRSKCVLSGAVHPPRPPRIGRGCCCARTHKKGSLWPSGFSLLTQYK